ncbi:MAG: MFS transporter [Thermoanaerobaculales bacterium]|nr:MFS transporter [Thermoanaerobaculales bacterium]
MNDASNILGQRRWLVLASAVVSFFAVGTTFFAVPPLVPALSEAYGLSHLHLGFLMGAIAVPAIFLSIPLGAAVDRWPARAAGNLALMVMFGGAALFALAPGYGALLGGRIVFGIGGLVMNLLVARLISDAFSGRQLALAMGFFMAVYPASMIVVYSVHPFLFETLGRQGELMILAALAAVALPLHSLAIPRNVRGQAAAAKEGSKSLTVGRPLFALGFSWMLFFAAYAAVPTFAPGWAGGGKGGLLTVTVLMWVALVFSPLAGAVIDRVGRPVAWVVLGQLLLAGVLALMSASLVPPLVAMLLVGLCLSAVPTATYALPGRLVPPERVGFAFGFITAFSNLGTVIGPPVAGALWDATGGWTLSWAVLAVIAVVGGGVAGLIGKTE